MDNLKVGQTNYTSLFTLEPREVSKDTETPKEDNGEVNLDYQSPVVSYNHRGQIDMVIYRNESTGEVRSQFPAKQVLNRYTEASSLLIPSVVGGFVNQRG